MIIIRERIKLQGSLLIKSTEVETHFQFALISDLLLVDGGENFPETQSLISSAGHNGGAIGTGSEVEDAVGVASETGDLAHGRAQPHIELVVGVAVGADQLAQGLAEV